MAETKRVPTEAEARMLLRDVARKMEDEAAIGEAAQGRAPRATRVVAGSSLLVVLSLAGALWIARDEVPFVVTAPLILLAVLNAFQAVQVAELRRATHALARTAERARRAEPLPKAPSLPAG